MPSKLPTPHLLFCALAFSIAGCAVDATHDAPVSTWHGDVQNGIDVLRAADFASLAGRRIGLITNHTGVDRSGESSANLLHRAPGVELAALFSPEHGFYGVDEGAISDAKHPGTGLPIYSLYTKERAPNQVHLEGLDALVFDIQDIGCRFYTYISTMGEAMQVAARQGIEFIVLDRPNPIGAAVGGPMRDSDMASFVAWHDLPVRHGMTVGELATMFNRERKIGVRLTVVKMEGYQREMMFDATGQTFVNPSPNMRSPAQALLYPGVGLLEFTNLSVGRGTDTPFELIGAPWMDGAALAASLHAAGIPGLRCVPIRFTPTASKHKGVLCQGVRFWITERDRFDPIRLGIELATALRRLHRETWDMKRYPKLLANRKVLEQIRSGEDASVVMAGIETRLAPFLRRRADFLLYP